jgi:hypothetical protein
MRVVSRHLAIVATVGLLPLAVSAQAAAAAAPSPHLGGAQPSSLSAADIQRLSAMADHRSIIIFKNQHPDLPARGATGAQRTRAVDADQASTRRELAQLHAPDVKSFHLVSAVSATISKAEADRLSSDPAVQAVVPDSVRTFAPLDQTSASPGAGPGASSEPGAQQVCPTNPADPFVEPEARQVMNVVQAQQIVDGTGLRVGIIADGLDPNNPDLIRANGAHVVFDFRDFSGYGNNAPTDGREAFLDAGAIAAQANQTYDLAGFVNPAHPLPPGCTIKIEGVAPGASLAVFNVAGSAAGFFNSQIIQAIEWAVDVDHVDVLNESFGANPIPDTHDDPVALADQAAVAAGVTVVVSSGDAGPTNTIGSPASDPGVITAGGSTTLRVYRQTTRYGTQLVTGGWLNDNITALSSSGTTEFGPRTVDVVAPGDRGWALCSSDTTQFFGCADIDHGTNPPPIWAAGGTSMSAPLTSGTAALVIQAYEKTHGGAKPAPDLVKRIIVSTATDLVAPADHQGAGLVNTLKAVQLAESDANGSGGPQGNALLASTPNLVSTGQAGTTRTFQVSVTNEAAASQTVRPGVFALNPSALSSDTGSVNLSSASPTFIDGEGNTDFYAIHQFAVPAHADYLNGDIAWDAVPPTLTPPGDTAAFETLFDPSGQVAGYSLLGANHSGHGHVEVRQPTAGTWTAVIFTVHNAAVYSGTVTFSYATQDFQQTGLVSPAQRVLAPGQTGAFRVTVSSVSPGDQSFSLRLLTGGPDDGSLPILIRSLVPVTPSGGTFQGALTGGANIFSAGQQVGYQFDVPAREPSLEVVIQLQNADYNLEGFLVDPTGEPVDVQSTARFDAQDNFLGYGRTMQFFRRTPAAGRWTVTLLVFGPIDGRRLNEPFTGTISFAPPVVQTAGLPSSRATVLRAGVPAKATITVTNTGNVRKDFFADARLDGPVPQLLLGTDIQNVPLPLSILAQPNWLVPPDTSSFTVVAQGTVPIVMDISALNGDPDRLGRSFPGNVAVANLSSPEVAPGFLFGLPEALGPFPATGIGSGATVNLAALADTNPFDTAVSATSGDVWAQSVDASAPYSPVSVAPGRTRTITLSITPNAPKGTVVRGFVAVDTFNLATFSGDELVQIPYTYRVG